MKLSDLFEDVDDFATTKFWYNPETKQTLSFNWRSDHTRDVLNNPQRYGIAQEEVDAAYDSDDGVYYNKGIIWLMLSKGWSRVVVIHDQRGAEIAVEATSIKMARTVILQKKKLIGDTIRQITADIKINKDDDTFYRLRTEQDINNFIKFGTVRD